MRHQLASEQILASPPRAARLAVATVFVVSGVVLANWVSRIPAIQRGLGLGEGALGLALLSAAVGALVAMPVAGWLIARLGSRPVTIVSALLYCASLPLLALAPSVPAFVLALGLFGAFNGAMDVAMNAQAVVVEQRYGRPIMSGFHGLWSIGGVVGAGIGGVVASLGVTPIPHLLGAAVVLGLVALVASRGLLPAGVDGGAGGPAFARPSGALIGIGLIAFCVMLGEGAMADWGAVYLQGTLGAGPGLAAAGFGAFSLAMAAGRLAGDRLTQRFGPVALLRVGGTLAAVGLGAALLIGRPLPTLIGFACAGLGFSIGVPIAFSAAGSAPGIASGPAIAAVSTVGYSGFLVGPPVIGVVAELSSLRLALGTVVLLSVVSALLAHSVGRAATTGERPTRSDGEQPNVEIAAGSVAAEERG
ncbi:MAG: MFS transporter [Chloroflexota bacterium]|nr:MFS transporter [Chloroflexota bacterium]